MSANESPTINWSIIGTLEACAYAALTSAIMISAYYYANEKLADHMAKIAQFWMFAGYAHILIQVLWMGNSPQTATGSVAVRVICGLMSSIAVIVVLTVNAITPNMEIEREGWILLWSVIFVAAIDLALIPLKLKMIATGMAIWKTPT